MALVDRSDTDDNLSGNDGSASKQKTTEESQSQARNQEKPNRSNPFSQAPSVNRRGEIVGTTPVMAFRQAVERGAESKAKEIVEERKQKAQSNTMQAVLLAVAGLVGIYFIFIR